MIDGRRAIFISCSEKFRERVAHPFRDVIEALGLRAVIVSDLPAPTGVWSPEEKVDAYLDRSEAMLVLATPDDLVGDQWQTRLNIADEIGRARSRSEIRGRICVLKDASVKLPSNINPVYDRLDADDLAPALTRFLSQLAEWGFIAQGIQLDDVDVAAPTDDPDEALVAGLRMDDPKVSHAHVRDQLDQMSKAEQRLYVRRLLELLRRTQRWETRATVGHMFEAIADIDPSLLGVELIEELARDADFSLRSSAAMVLYLRSLSAPGTVPLDLVARLAGDGDWYVYMPGISALQETALTRQEAMERIELLAASPDPDLRERMAKALLEVVEIKPSVVPPALIERLLGDERKAVRDYAERAAELAEGLSEKERREGYYRFGPF